MLFRGKTISEIEEDDLLRLIETTNEGQEVDFKISAYSPPPESQLPANQSERDRVKNKWKIDLCTDVTAFANASGGWIICGMEEQGGTASVLCGLGSSVNGEREVARLGQCANSGIEPIVHGLRIETINLQDSTKSKAIVIYIPRSYSAPHRVKETSKFYIRRSNRNDEMNVDELRVAFNLSVTLSDRIKRFREERVKALGNNDEHEEIPVRIESGMRIILHVIPLSFSDISSAVSLKSLDFLNKSFDDADMLNNFTTKIRYGFDGLTLPVYYLEDQAREYFQVFRSGVVEYVEVRALSYSPSGNLIYPYDIEDQALLSLQIAWKMLRQLEVRLPLIVMLSLSGVKGSQFSVNRSLHHARPNIINRDAILIPDVVIENYDQDLRTLMRPVFDILWNTGGYRSSPSYDAQTGIWKRNLR